MIFALQWGRPHRRPFCSNRIKYTIVQRQLRRNGWKTAVSESLMVITMDKDFGELVYRSGLSHAGVLFRFAWLHPFQFGI
jgi:hypothetical protein